MVKKKDLPKIGFAKNKDLLKNKYWPKNKGLPKNKDLPENNDSPKNKDLIIPSFSGYYLICLFQ